MVIVNSAKALLKYKTMGESRSARRNKNLTVILFIKQLVVMPAIIRDTVDGL